MAEIINFKPNNFCWLDFGANDIKSANSFYTGLFGWKIQNESNNGSDYFMLTLKDKTIGGSMELTQEMKDMNVPPCWTSYIGVTNIEECLEKVKSNGGKVLYEACEVPEAGRWALFMDSENAVIGLWEPKNLQGFAFKDEPSAPCWFELASNSPEETLKFYVNVFGWTVKKENMNNMDYYTFNNGTESVAGMFKMPPELKGIPPHWLPYFAIDNIDIAIEKINSGNGVVLMPKAFVDGIGYFGVYKDNQGGAFGLIQAV